MEPGGSARRVCRSVLDRVSANPNILALTRARTDTESTAYFVTQAILMFVFALYRSVQLIGAFELRTPVG